MTLAEAAAEAAALADAGNARELANLRAEWDEEVEAAARNPDYRQRTVAFRAIGQFRFRQKIELLRRGLEDESPACRGSALLSLDQLSTESPGVVNAVRPLLHELLTHDPNQAVRRLAVVALRHGTGDRATVLILSSLAENDEEPRELRETAAKIAALLKKKSAGR